MCLLYVRRCGLIDINNTGKSLTVMQPHYLAAAARKGGWGGACGGGGDSRVTPMSPEGQSSC